MDASGTRYGLSITLPSSYWYLRNFDIVTMDPVVDWFNIMSNGTPSNIPSTRILIK